jgi:DinB superfamily
VVENNVIDRFEALGPIVVYAATGLTREQEQARPGPGDWSIAELVVHLLDSDLVAGDRIKRLIAEENPTLLAYDQDAWNSRLRANELPVLEAAELFSLNRKWVARLLRNCTEADFARGGVHSEDGPVTLAKMVAKYITHIDNHLKFLYAKRANLGTSIYPKYSDSTD